MHASTTAVVLVGFQGDYFAPGGALHDVVSASLRTHHTLDTTLALLHRLARTATLLLSTPIVFTPSYEELVDPVGVLALVRERRAFQAGAPGARPIPELEQFGDAIVEVPGKRGLNAFSHTELDRVLREREIEDVVLAGAVTSISVDATGRAAHERGYRVHVLRDCIASRTSFEHRFFCEQVFPLYAQVLDSPALLERLGLAPVKSA